jgi:hypothetical protein
VIIMDLSANIAASERLVFTLHALLFQKVH